MRVAAPPFPQRLDRGKARRDHCFKLIGRRRRPELDAERACGEHRGLPADLPLAELLFRGRAGCARKAAVLKARRSRLPSIAAERVRRCDPCAETTVLSCLASSVTASGSGLTNSNFRTLRALVCRRDAAHQQVGAGGRAGRRHAHARRSVERLETGDLGEGGDGAVLGGWPDRSLGPPCSREPLE